MKNLKNLFEGIFDEIDLTASIFAPLMVTGSDNDAPHDASYIYNEIASTINEEKLISSARDKMEAMGDIITSLSMDAERYTSQVPAGSRQYLRSRINYLRNLEMLVNTYGSINKSLMKVSPDEDADTKILYLTDIYNFSKTCATEMREKHLDCSDFKISYPKRAKVFRIEIGFGETKYNLAAPEGSLQKFADFIKKYKFDADPEIKIGRSWIILNWKY